MSAGLPAFRGLIDHLEADARGHGGFQSTAVSPDDFPTRAQDLEDFYGDADTLKARVREGHGGSRYALGHGLLASLRIRESITTNFDSLYELACERPFPNGDGTEPELAVLPWRRS